MMHKGIYATMTVDRQTYAQAAHKGISFIVTVDRETAVFLTDPATDPDARAGCLLEMLERGEAQAGGSRVRRGRVAVKVLAVAPRTLGYQFLAAEPRHCRPWLVRLLAHPSTLIVAVSLAPSDAPVGAWSGVPLTLLDAAQAIQASHRGARFAPVAARVDEVA